MDSHSTGLFVIAAGVIIVAVGLLIMSGGLGWFGRLPGDIRVERENVRIYIPLVSMLLLSIALSIVLYIVRRFL